MERFMDDIDRFKQKKSTETTLKFWGGFVEESPGAHNPNSKNDSARLEFFTMKAEPDWEPISPVKELK